MINVFARTIGICTGLYVMACSLFFVLLIHYNARTEVLLTAIGFAVILALLLVSFMLAVRKQMNSIVYRLSETIQSLMDHQERGLFPEFEDSLLSKLQDQIIKLSRMIRRREQRCKEESEEVKSLISDIAHQLKTPLANLNMYVGLLADHGMSDEKRREVNTTLADQTEKLTWLLDSLIRMSRLESGIIAIHGVEHSLAGTALSAIKQVYSAAEVKGIELVYRGGADITFSHDPKWTAEAIVNVLDNAIKYSEPGGQVSLSMVKYELFVRMDIEDEGIGIAEEEHNRIFQRFYRGREVKQTEGVGLGLYLARNIITKQGGYMRVESEPGKGSRFSIFLPVETDASSSASGSTEIIKP
ncbi:sensor histidine kinase [Paenibacillus sp. 1011MAR3C5]|uniref:sensor histidine kinase n=1 Tax=Paenibacillus sp. 1011MAR3C5 TaxID=1675787 RepID=UPI000E6CD551|nr:HAMP domain-containing sensor histidine kinase [Paenibacillus sp. 1011MAR3C5]RJE90136.1 sensor histidine kinase [Paenibacillus sp. 1011MAR3C5]